MNNRNKISRRGFLGAVAAVGGAALAGCAVGPYTGSNRRVADRPAGRLPGRSEFVVREAHVLTMDPALGDLERGDVHVRDGRIIAVGKELATPGAEVIDGREMIALPGLIDTHWHLWTTPFRNLVGEGPQRGYFPVTEGLGRHFTSEDSYRGVRLGLAEALFSGITTVHDWAHNIRSPAHADAEIRALTEMGVRARFSYGNPQLHPREKTMDLADLARVKREWFSAPGDGLLTLGMATRNLHPTSPRQTSLEVLRREWEAARALGIPITMHASQGGLAESLGRAKLLGPDVQFIHGIFATPKDREIIAATGTHMSISPFSEMRALLGFPQLGEMLAAGVLVSLSFDTSALTGSADMFATMRVALDVEYTRSKKPLSITPRRMLELATIDGARDLGLADRVGSLTPGKRADLILVRTTDLNMAPVVDPVNTLVHCAQPANVDTVIVDGQILKRRGQLVAFDVEEVIREAAESLAAVRARAGGP